MSKAITSCKKALAYLLTAAMVLGMAVTSPITAVEVKADDEAATLSVANGATSVSDGDYVTPGTELKAKITFKSDAAEGSYDLYMSTGEITAEEPGTLFGTVTHDATGTEASSEFTFTAGAEGDVPGSVKVYAVLKESGGDAVAVAGSPFTINYSYKIKNSTALDMPEGSGATVTVSNGADIDMGADLLDKSKDHTVKVAPQDGYYVKSAKVTIPQPEGTDNIVVNLSDRENADDGSINGKVNKEDIAKATGDLVIDAEIVPVVALTIAGADIIPSNTPGSSGANIHFTNACRADNGTATNPLVYLNKNIAFEVTAQSGKVVEKVNITSATNGHTYYGDAGVGLDILSGEGSYTINSQDVTSDSAMTITITSAAGQPLYANNVETGYTVKIKDGKTIGESGVTVKQNANCDIVVEKTGEVFVPEDIVVGYQNAENESASGSYTTISANGSDGAYYYTIPAAGLNGNKTYIKVGNQKTFMARIIGNNSSNHACVNFENGDAIGPEPSGVVTVGKAFKFKVTPDEGYGIGDVQVSINGNSEDADFTLKDSGGTNSFAGNIVKNEGDGKDGSWEITLTKDQLATLDEGLVIKVLPVAKKKTITIKVDSDKTTVTNSNIGSYMTFEVGGTSASPDSSLEIKNKDYDSSVEFTLKTVTGLDKSVNVYETANPTKTVKITESTETPGTYTLDNNLLTDITIDATYHFANTIYVKEKGSVSTASGKNVKYTVKSDDENQVKLITAAAGEEPAVYRVQNNEPILITIDSVETGSSVSVTANKGTIVKDGDTYEMETVATGTTFTVEETGNDLTLTKSVANGYNIKVRVNNTSGTGEFVDMSSYPTLKYGDKLEFRIYGPDGAAIKHATAALNTIINDNSNTTPNGNAVLICSMLDENGKEISGLAASLIAQGEAGSDAAKTGTMTISKVRGNITLGARAKEIDVESSNNYVVAADSNKYKVVAPGRLTVPESTPKAYYENAYQFQVIEPIEDTDDYRYADPSSIRVKYRVNAADATAAGEYTKEIEAVDGIYTIPADEVEKKVWLRIEEIHTINVSMDGTRIDATNTKYNIDTAEAGSQTEFEKDEDGTLKPIKNSAYDLLGAKATARYNIYLTVNAKTGYVPKVLVNGEEIEKKSGTGVALKYEIPLNKKTNEGYDNTTFVFPNSIEITTEEQKYDFTVNTSDMKSDFSLSVTEDGKAVPKKVVEDEPAGQSTYEFLENGTYRIAITGLDDELYDLTTTTTMAKASDGDTHGKFREVSGLDNTWEISGLKASKGITFAEAYKANKNVSVTGDTNLKLEITYFENRDTGTGSGPDDDGRTGLQEETSTITAAGPTTINVFPGKDVKVKVTPKSKFATEYVKANGVEQTGNDGVYTISTFEFDNNDTIVAKSIPDAGSYYVIDFVLDRDITITDAKYTQDTADDHPNATITNGLRIYTKDGKVEFTPAGLTGYNVKDVTVANGYKSKGADKYTITMAAGDTGESGKATVTVTQEAKATTKDVLFKINGGTQDHISVDVEPKHYNEEKKNYTISAGENEAILSILVDKNWKLGTISDTNSAIKSLGDREDNGEGKWVYKYSVNGSILETKGATSAGSADVITIGAPVEQKIVITNGSATNDISTWTLNGTAQSKIASSGTTKISADKEIVIEIPSALKLLVDGVDVCVPENENYKEDAETGKRTYTFTPSLDPEKGEANSTLKLELVKRTGLEKWTIAVQKGTSKVAEEIVDSKIDVTDPADTYKVYIYRVDTDGQYIDLTSGTDGYTITAVDGDGEETNLEFATSDYTTSAVKCAYLLVNASTIDSTKTYSFKAVKDLNGEKEEFSASDIGQEITFKVIGKPKTDGLTIKGLGDGNKFNIKADSENIPLDVELLDTNNEIISNDKFELTFDPNTDKSGKLKVEYKDGQILVSAKDVNPKTEQPIIVTVKDSDPEVKATFTVVVTEKYDLGATTATPAKGSMVKGGSFESAISVLDAVTGDDLAAAGTVTITTSAEDGSSANLSAAVVGNKVTVTASETAEVGDSATFAILVDGVKTEAVIEATVKAPYTVTGVEITSPAKKVVELSEAVKEAAVTYVVNTDEGTATDLETVTITPDDPAGLEVTPDNKGNITVTLKDIDAAAKETKFSVKASEGTADSFIIKVKKPAVEPEPEVEYEEEYTTLDDDNRKDIEEDLKAVVTLSKDSFTYNGKEIEPKVTVKATIGGKTVTLKEGTDYRVAYDKNHISAGDKKVYVHGINDYKGTIGKDYKIAPKALKNLKYTGYVVKDSEGTPIISLSVADGSKGLKRDVDYEIVEESYKDVSKTKGSVNIKGIGNYEETEFTCSKLTVKTMSSKQTAMVARVELAIEGYEYTGTKIEPKATDITVYDTEDNEVASSNYKVKCTNNINVGTATITVTGTGSYGGVAVANYSIDVNDEYDLENASVTVKSPTYNGKLQKPAVTVYSPLNSKKKLVKGKDYVLVYANNLNASKEAKVYIKGIGNYAEQIKECQFQIKPADISKVKIEGKKGAVTGITFNKKQLKSHVDYEAKVVKDSKTGKYNIEVRGTNDEAGSKEGNFYTKKNPKVMKKIDIEQIAESIEPEMPEE